MTASANSVRKLKIK
jgi:hypothetical protein